MFFVSDTNGIEGTLAICPNWTRCPRNDHLAGSGKHPWRLRPTASKPCAGKPPVAAPAACLCDAGRRAARRQGRHRRQTVTSPEAISVFRQRDARTALGDKRRSCATRADREYSKDLKDKQRDARPAPGAPSLPAFHAAVTDAGLKLALSGQGYIT